MTEPRSIEPQFNPCERHPDCLFQGGCECKRQQMRERRTVPQNDSPQVCRYCGDPIDQRDDPGSGDQCATCAAIRRLTDA